VGTYYRKHNPLISFNSIRNNATRCAKIVNADEFDTDLNGKAPRALFLAVPQRPSKRLLFRILMHCSRHPAQLVLLHPGHQQRRPQHQVRPAYGDWLQLAVRL
jgi:hypothetical protein